MALRSRLRTSSLLARHSKREQRLCCFTINSGIMWWCWHQHHHVAVSFWQQQAAEDVAPYLSALKSHAYPHSLAHNELLITADTVVILGNDVLGKPKDEEEARATLRRLSGNDHYVITGVTLRMQGSERTFSSRSRVRFATLTEEQIDYYVDNYRPMDKAGAYGIQEWIGYVGIEELEGSFYNVMGLPVQRLCRELEAFIEAWPECNMR